MIALGRHDGEHLAHADVDRLLAGCHGYRHPVMAIFNEVQVAHLRHAQMSAALGAARRSPSSVRR
jgi:hypothetical protein